MPEIGWFYFNLVFPKIFPGTAPALPTPRIDPPQRIRRIPIQILATRQPNRVLRGKPSHRRIVVAEVVLVQPAFPSDEPDFLALAALRGGFSDASPKSVVVVTRLTVQGCAVPGLGVDHAVFSIVNKALCHAVGAAFFRRNCPRRHRQNVGP